jgi:predicted dehydrogenase
MLEDIPGPRQQPPPGEPVLSQLRFGLIGTGFMGKAHAIALRAVGTVFPEVAAPRMTWLVDAESDKATRSASGWGFEKSGTDWRALCESPDIDAVSICTPNHLHRDMALTAIASGKHVWCEKPLALTVADAREIHLAAAAAGVQTSMGFNYMCNPLILHARNMIAAGEIGDVFNFRGAYNEDYQSDPKSPFSWRCLRSQGGSGALNDLGTHLINMAEYLLGPIATVFGSLITVHKERPDPASGNMRTVENEDIAQILLTFDRGCPGTMEISRIATGRKCGLTFEICGSKGSLVFDQERMNELQYYSAADSSGRRGFRTIMSGPEHPDYAAFCPAPGHGLGINDLKIIEARNLLRAIDSGKAVFSNIANGYRVQCLVDAIEASHAAQQWTVVKEPS